MPKSIAEREALVDQCEDFMLRGYDRPATIARNLDVKHPTAKSLIASVRARWKGRAESRERETYRQELIEQARQAVRDAYADLAAARNFAGNTFNARASFIRNAITAQERLARLLGLEVTRVELMNQEKLDAATDEILAGTNDVNGAAAFAADPVRALRGLLGDSEQGRADGAVRAEPASAPHAEAQA